MIYTIINDNLIQAINHKIDIEELNVFSNEDLYQLMVYNCEYIDEDIGHIIIVDFIIRKGYKNEDPYYKVRALLDLYATRGEIKIDYNQSSIKLLESLNEEDTFEDIEFLDVENYEICAKILESRKRG